MNITAVGDSAIKVEFQSEVTPKLNQQILQFCHQLQDADIEGVVEWVPAFNSVTVYYKPTILLFHELVQKMESIVIHHIDSKTTSRLHHVPVLYGGEFGPDLERVATYNRLSNNEVIQLHQEPKYLVYMLGFLPGFPYLGGLHPKIATPRLDEPRSRTFAGAVGIAHEQTGIYPIESPGGWNIIGKTPIKLFYPNKRANPFQFKAGDRVKFFPITVKEYQEIEQQINNDEYKIHMEHSK